MAIKLVAHGQTVGLQSRLTARVAVEPPSDVLRRGECALVVADPSRIRAARELAGYAAIVTTSPFRPEILSGHSTPIVHLPVVDHLKDGYIIAIEPASGFVRVLYRQDSPHNVIFTTDRCNSKCLMCSQPPKDVDDRHLVDHHLRMIELISEPPLVLGITGGEPTLLGEDLVRILVALKKKFPTTYVHMLTNGRLYKYAEFVQHLAAVQHPAFTSAIPLYADVAGIHDYIVQASGAFDETVQGLYNAAEAALSVEIRVVLHRQSIPRLPQLAEYVYRNFPFVRHVALMGLEHTGFVTANWEDLWIDPVEYQPVLARAVEILHRRGMHTSIYNLPLCLLDKSLWSFARKSISDFKNIYLDPCDTCSVKPHCSGLFLSQQHRHSAHIRPFV